MSALSGLRDAKYIVPLSLLVICGAAYGVFLPWFGLYGNDWPYLWHYHLFGPLGPAGFAALDRPLSAWIYALTTGLFGEAVWLYHVFMLGLRWVSGWLLWILLSQLFPKSGRFNATSAMLFVVYPAFLGQPIALEFLLHFTVLNLTLASLVLMVKVHSTSTGREWRNRVLTGLGMVGAAGIFSLEYFIGLEVLRPIFLWIVMRRGKKPFREMVGKVLLAWLPYLVVLAAFLIWRVMIFKFPTYQPVVLSALAATPMEGLRLLVNQMTESWKVMLVDTWIDALRLPQQGIVLTRYVGFSAVTFLIGLAGIYLVKEKIGSEQPGERSELSSQTLPVGLGAVGLLFAGIPFWVTGIPVRLDFPWDRSTMAFLFGSSLFITGLVWLVIKPRFQPVAAAVLIGLSGGQHYLNALEYRSEWEKLRNFTWQMSWRMPGLTPGTLVLYDDIPLNRYADTDLTGVLNWTYAPQGTSRDLPYKFFDLHIRLDTEYIGLPGLKEGLVVEHNHRSLRFLGSTSQMVLVDYRPPGCFRVLGPGDENLPGLSEKMKKVISLSKPALIELNTAMPPSMFLPEPDKNWCFYYQKAELARQGIDWKKVSEIGETILSKGLKAELSEENFPFIEAAIRLKNWEKATIWIQKADQPTVKPALCSLLNRISTGLEITPDDREQLRVVQNKVLCNP